MEEQVKIICVERKGQKYLVYSSIDEEPLKVTEDVIVNYRIIKGALIENSLWQQIKEGKDQALLFDKVLHYIDFKPRTIYEVKNYLLQKGAEADKIEEIIIRLIAINYLNDEKYAHQYVDEQIRNLKGPNAIYYNLSNLGIEDNLIKTALISYNKEKELENAMIVANKTKRLNEKYPQKKQQEKIYQKLLVMGYSYEIINQVQNSIDYQEDSLEALEKAYLQLLKKLDITKDKNKIITSLMSKGYRYEDIKKVINK